MIDTYLPSPTDRIGDQVARYEACDGADGGTMEGRPVVAANAGATVNPAWYRNLIARPDVWLKDGAVTQGLRAREVFGEEKTQTWAIAERYWPHFPNTAPTPAAG